MGEINAVAGGAMVETLGDSIVQKRYRKGTDLSPHDAAISTSGIGVVSAMLALMALSRGYFCFNRGWERRAHALPDKSAPAQGDGS